LSSSEKPSVYFLGGRKGEEARRWGERKRGTGAVPRKGAADKKKKKDKR